MWSWEKEWETEEGREAYEKHACVLNNSQLYEFVSLESKFCL